MRRRSFFGSLLALLAAPLAAKLPVPVDPLFHGARRVVNATFRYSAVNLNEAWMARALAANAQDYREATAFQTLAAGARLNYVKENDDEQTHQGEEARRQEAKALTG